MADDEYSEIQDAAAAARVTVSEWVRVGLRVARAAAPHDRDPGGGVVRERVASYGDLLTKVMQRYGLPDEESAVRFALRRAADPPLSGSEILALEGTGWEGDLGVLRSAAAPESLP